MDLEVFARQIQDARGRVHSLLREAGGASGDLEQALEITFAELNTTFEELHVAEEELLAQQQELLSQQQIIAEERQRYQDLFEFAPDGYLITDQRGLIRQANRAAATLLNHDQQRITGLPLTVFVVQADVPALLNHLRRLRYAQPGELLEWDLRIQPHHAAPYDAWLRVAPIFDQTRHVVGMRWLLRDISARKQAEAERLELRAREVEQARLVAVLQHMPAGVMIVEAPSGRLLLSNAQAEAILPQALAGGVLLEQQAGLHRDRQKEGMLERTIARALAGETIRHQELDVARADQTPAIIHVSAAPIHDGNGQTVAAVAAFHDITRHRLAERSIQASEAKLRALLNSADQLIVLIAPDGTIQEFNYVAAEHALATFGLEMAVGQSMLRYVWPDERDSFKLHLEQALAGSRVALEKPMEGRSGTEWWELHYYPILLPGDQTMGVHFMAHNITERKQTERRLLESEARLRLAMEAAQMGHWDWDIRSGQVVGSWERNAMLGLPLDRIDGSYEQFIACLHPDDRERVARMLKEAQAERKPYQSEFRVIWPDGSIHWIVGDGRAYYDEDGRAIRMLGVIRDITARKQAQAELEVAEQRLHTVVANAPIVLWALDREGMFTLSEGKSLDVLGLQPGEVVGRSVYEVYANEPSLLDNIGRAFAGQAQSWVQAVDGLLFDVHITPLRDQRGAISGLIGVSTDITERKRAETALHLLVEATTLLSASLDYEATLAQVARLLVPGLADLCVVCMQETGDQTQRIEVVLAEPSPAADLDAVKQLVRDGWSALMAEAVLHKQAILLSDPVHAARAVPDHRHRQLMETLGVRSLMIVPLYVRGHTLGALIVGALHTRSRYDQTDLAFVKELAYRVALAVDNARLYRDAQAAIAARDTFLSIASHELKTPLTSMIGYTYLLQHTSKDALRSPERIRQAVDVIARQTQRLNRLIEDLLDLSRIQRGQWSLVLQPFDLVPLLDRMIEETRLTSQRHTITLSCADDELIVNGDEGRVEQVLHNLLSNAVKYSPSGGPIRVQVTRQVGTVQISVSDQGIGIPHAAQARLWEPFYRAGNVGKQSSGFGIGLYIAHEIVQRHGGTIAVQSAEGQGSTFTVTLPMYADAI